jgi:uridine kinase
MDGQQQQHDACTTTPSRPPRPPTPAMTMDDADLDNSWQPKRHPPFVIGVAGGTASGKTTVCDRIMQRLNDKSVVLISQDAFYRPLTEPEREAAKGNSYNFDHPDAFDNALLLECLRALAEGRAFDCPTYDFATHSRTSETRRIEPADVIVLEGILVLAVPAVREACSLRVYVDTDDDVRLARRIQRDVAVRGRDVAGVIAQYQRFVKPCFDTFVSPSRRFADVIVPWHDGGGPGGGLGAAGWLGGLGGEAATADGASFAATAGDRASAGGAATTGGASCGNNSNEGGNIVAIDLIEQHIRSKLQQHPLRRLFPTLSLIPPSFQLVGMLTILRDATTPKDQFVFYADRVIRLVVEAGLGHLPFTEKEVSRTKAESRRRRASSLSSRSRARSLKQTTPPKQVRTPTSRRYVGVEFCKGICGVSIIRSG